ncbi:PAS domain-containing protein [Lacticigenium naphthae]|uniref:PAS domain-containing protein n=1 Tax=Lacticigenium naphthae TaxID=515351 RepID=UPI0004863B37|nr:PAS domain-containing protein [Lacticigenium naphthae]
MSNGRDSRFKRKTFKEKGGPTSSSQRSSQMINRRIRDSRTKNSKQVSPPKLIRYKEIFEKTGMGAWEWNVETGKSFYNEGWAQLIGYSLDEFPDISIHTFYQFLHPQDKDRVQQKLKNVFEKKEGVYEIEIRMQHKKGHWIWIEDRGIVVEWSENGDPLLMFGTHRDITHLREVEKEAQRESKEYQLLIENTYDLVYRISSNGEVKFVSPRWEKVIDSNLVKAEKVYFSDFIHPKDKIKVQGSFQKLLASKKKQEVVNFRLKTLNEKWKWFTTKAEPVLDENEKVIEIIGVVHDVNEIYESNLQIKKHKQELERFFSVTMDLFAISDENGNILKANPTWKKILGYKEEDLLGKSFMQFIVDEDKEETKKIIAGLKTKRKGSFINHYHSKKRGIRSIEWKASTHDNKIFASGRDITDQEKRKKDIDYLSSHDMLTGLYNRRFFSEKLKEWNKKNCFPLSIIYFDLNGLKFTNDVFGHQKGDELLIAIAKIIHDRAGDRGIFCRYGGDEFALLLPNTSKQETAKLMMDIEDECNSLSRFPIYLSVAIGAATKTSSKQNIQAVMNRADQQMYMNKLTSRKQLIQRIHTDIFSPFKDGKEEAHMHGQRMGKLAVAMAIDLQWTVDEIENLEKAALFHDIGKIVLPEKQKLSREQSNEWLKKHTVSGFTLIKNIDEYLPFAKWVLYHHEYIDGSGNPEGLIGEEIPLASRILSLLEFYIESLESGKTAEEVQNLLMNQAGIKFDADLVKRLVRIEMQKINQE